MAVERAILLLAGKGTRMGNLTSDVPKCLLPVGGRPILDRTLESLVTSGVSEIVAVVGYRDERVRAFVERSPWASNVTFVRNETYATTNTVYSLWLAQRYLDRACYLIEGDIVFGSEVLRRIARAGEEAAIWSVVPVSAQECTGIVLAGNAAGEVSDVTLLREPEAEPRRFGFKCAGIQRLTDSLAVDLKTTLDAWVVAGRTRMFADLALAEALRAHRVRLCNLLGVPWCEVDSPEDLARSEAIFGHAPTALRA